MAKEQRGIQSIDVGGRLLQALTRSDGAMMLKDLAEAADMPPAKAHAYLVSFCKLGLMEQDAVTGRYDLGPLALELGLVSLNRLDAVKIASAEMSALAARIGQSTAIAVWGNYGPTIVRFEQSVRPIHVNMRTGTVMQIQQTATGLVFAAFIAPAQIEAALLATSPDLGKKFDDTIDWGQLPLLQQRDNSLSEFGLDDWGSIRMAMPVDLRMLSARCASSSVVPRPQK